MMKLIGVSFLLLLVGYPASKLSAQSHFFSYFTDTIKPGFRVSGSFDSTDVVSAPYQHNLPTLFQPAQQSFTFMSLHRDRLPHYSKRFSAIPHVGFRYAMGANATQIGKIMYTQAIDSFSFLQLDYQRSVSQAALRNGNFEYNAINVAYLHRKKRYSLALNVSFLGEKRGLNGGLLGDTLSDSQFGLIFQAVEKNNSFSTGLFSPNSSGVVYKDTKNFEVSVENYFSLIANDQLKTGFYIHPYLTIENRRFIENGAINTIYGNANYDTSATRDFWQKSEIGATTGYFFHAKTIQLSAGINTSYWDYDNLIIHRDTVSLVATGAVTLALKSGFIWKSHAAINLLSALGELAYSSSLIQQNEIGKISLLAGLKRSYPELYQRDFYSNTTNYSWTDRTLFTHVFLGGGIDLKRNKTNLLLSARYELTDNLPLFIGNRWRQDTLSQLEIFSFKAASSFVYKRLFFQPTLTVQLSESTIIPKFLFAARLGFNGTLFSSKKMKTAMGVDIGYTSSFQLMEYIPHMQTFAFSNTTQVYAAMPKLHFFANFDLGFFRWFFRLENIEQVFQEQINFDALGYPVVPMQFRFGVSWDLFN